MPSVLNQFQYDLFVSCSNLPLRIYPTENSQRWTLRPCFAKALREGKQAGNNLLHS